MVETNTAELEKNAERVSAKLDIEVFDEEMDILRQGGLGSSTKQLTAGSPSPIKDKRASQASSNRGKGSGMTVAERNRLKENTE